MKKKTIRERINEILSNRTDNPGEKAKKEKLGQKLKENLKLIEDIIGFSDDVVVREFQLGGKTGIEAAIIFVDGLTDKQVINENILKPLLIEKFPGDELKDPARSDIIKFIKDKTITINELKVVDQLEKVIDGVLDGDTALLVDGYIDTFLLNTRGWDKRSISEPQSETVVRGPRDSFTENFRTNTALIRRRIKHPALRIKGISIGKYSRTNIAICYIEGLTNKYIVEEIKERISNIDIDNIQSSGTIEQLIEDNHFTPFPQLLSTERPDRVAANLLEGRVAIIVDGTPFALIAPITISIFLQSAEDYYDRFIIGSFLRVIRLLAIIIAMTLPALYISVISFHPEMVPTQLALAFAGGRAVVPFPAYIEAFIMTILMELLREASIRLPDPVGSTIGIVGALIVGEAAVSASIVSPFMVIIVATDTIASFAIPNYSTAIAFRLVKYPLMILATIFGLYGLVLGLIILSIHLAGLKSFGIPYLTPMAPSRLGDLQDTVLRPPIWSLRKRPEHLRTKNEKRFSSTGDDDGYERTR